MISSDDDNDCEEWKNKRKERNINYTASLYTRCSSLYIVKFM